MLTDYTGAGARLSPELGLALSPDRYGWQPKIDGCYARVSLDRRGRIANVLARSGSPIAEARDLIGIVAGPPDSVLHGELEAHTESGRRAADARGYAALHLFDATRLDGRSVADLAYADRYAALASTRPDALGNHWLDDSTGRAHHTRTGRFARRIPRDARRLPLIPLRRDASELWREHVDIGGGEGLVVVRLDAPARAIGGKRKIKATDTLDCTVLAIGGGAARLGYGGHVFSVSARGRWTGLVVGQVVEVAHDGWYEAGATPRFARIVRVRVDLAAHRDYV